MLCREARRFESCRPRTYNQDLQHFSHRQFVIALCGLSGQRELNLRLQNCIGRQKSKRALQDSNLRSRRK